MATKMSEKEGSTKVNITKEQVKEMELGYKFGLMDQNMRACGGETRPTARAE